jgi:hypothetical protein
VVHARWDLHDAVTEPDPLRALARSREEHLRRRRMRVFLEKVVFDQPYAIEAEAIGDLDLFEGILE